MYPQDLYTRKLYKSHINSNTLLESKTQYLETYHVVISRNLSVYQLLIEYLNIKSEDLYKESAINNLKNINKETEKEMRTVHEPFYYKIDNLNIDYLYLKVISKKLDLELFSQFLEINQEYLKILESEESENIFIYQFILSSENLKSLDLIKKTRN